MNEPNVHQKKPYNLLYIYIYAYTCMHTYIKNILAESKREKQNAPNRLIVIWTERINKIEVFNGIRKLFWLQQPKLKLSTVMMSDQNLKENGMVEKVWSSVMFAMISECG